MSGGYGIVMAALLAMARTFAAESRELSGAVSVSGVTVPDGGDALIDAALDDVVQAADMATGQFGAVVGEHGLKLHAAYERYRDAEESSALLCRDLARLITGGHG